MKKLILVISSIMILNNYVVYAATTIFPCYFELNANKTKNNYITGSFLVSCEKDEYMHFRIYPAFFEYDRKGKFIKLEDKGQKNSLVKHIRFYPSEFTCKNGLSQRIRFTITDLKSLPVGESKLVLFLEDVNSKKIIIRKINGEIKSKIIIKAEVGIPIYVDKGNYTKHGILNSVSIKRIDDEYACEYKISSTGNSRISYKGDGYLFKDNKLIKQFEVPYSTVENEKFLEKIQKLDIPKNGIKDNKEYKIKLILTYKDEYEQEKILEKEVIFNPEKIPNNKI